MAIATLTGDNGVLTKAGDARNSSTEAEVLEKLKLAYEDYYMGQHTQTGYTFQTALDKMFGTGVATASGPDSNGVYTVSVNGKKYTFDSITGTAEEYVVVPIKYYDSSNNEISKTDVDNMDYLIIGETEKFKVISTTNGILAMPYYNLVIVTADNSVKQGPAVDGESTELWTTFSEAEYWSSIGDLADLTESNIQQYITKYKTTLEKFGAKEIIVRAGKYSELNASGVTSTMRNPTRDNWQGAPLFWLGSVYPGDSSMLWTVGHAGDFIARMHNGSQQSNIGVRPVVEIH